MVEAIAVNGGPQSTGLGISMSRRYGGEIRAYGTDNLHNLMLQCGKNLPIFYLHQFASLLVRCSIRPSKSSKSSK